MEPTGAIYKKIHQSSQHLYMFCSFLTFCLSNFVKLVVMAHKKTQIFPRQRETFVCVVILLKCSHIFYKI